MKKIVLTLSCICIALNAHAQSIVAEYNFTAGVTSVDSDTTSIASPFGNDAGFTPTINGTAGNPFPSIQATADQISGSTSPIATPTTPVTTDYYTFTITPVAGFVLDFQTLRLDAATLNTVAAGTNNSFSISLQTSLNAFATNIATYTVSNNTSFSNFEWDLTSFASTSGTTPIEFRLAIRDDNSAGTRGLLIDNVVLAANVIPEPSTYAMMGLGLVLLVGVQRFRRKTS